MVYKKEQEKSKVQLSRRKFLTKTGIGLGVAVGALSLGGGRVFAAQADNGPAKELPWGYTPLDPERVRKLGHKGYYDGACSYGGFYAILAELQRMVGGPYKNVPAMMMKYGHGGIAGWGTTCGALNGSAAAISLAFSSSDADKIIGELMGWYSTTALPTDKANDYAVNNQYLVDKLKSDKQLVKSVSNSPLCHVSATEWAKEADVKISDITRKERCGRITGDTAARAVELMNAYHNGSFKATYAVSSSAESCLSCHSDHITGGNSDCLSCHEEHY